MVSGLILIILVSVNITTQPKQGHANEQPMYSLMSMVGQKHKLKLEAFFKTQISNITWVAAIDNIAIRQQDNQTKRQSDNKMIIQLDKQTSRQSNNKISGQSDTTAIRQCDNQTTRHLGN